MYKPLIRISPSEANLSSKVILNLIKKLDKMSEMHSIMIAKGGKVCAEGFWRPYAAGLNHCLWSQSKSYTITAIGKLIDEGKLDINEKVCEILCDYMPENMNDDLKKMTVRDLMCMLSGQHGPQSRTTLTWEKEFFSGDFYGTGKEFGYSGICSSLLGVILRVKTGESLIDYLSERVFEKIGIDAKSIKCMEHPDGIQYGGGGFMTKTEDSLRLGLLYANLGMWDGERVLSEEFIKEATSKQTETTNDYNSDNGCGYGYQIWMCKPEGVYRFDGAHGQYVIVDPKNDIVISIMQKGGGQEQLDVIWEALSEINGSTPEYDNELKYVLDRLAMPKDKILPYSKNESEFIGKDIKFPENELYIFSPMLAVFSYKVSKGVDAIRFNKKEGYLDTFLSHGGKEYQIQISLDGADRLSTMYIDYDMPSLVYAYGYFISDNELMLKFKFIEGAFETEHILKINDDGKFTFKNNFRGGGEVVSV